MIQYLLTQEQLQLLLWAIPDENRFKPPSVELRQSLVNELSRMLDRQAERLVLMHLSVDDAKTLGIMIGESSSEHAIQAFILRKIPNIASLTTELLKDFHSFFVPGNPSPEASIQEGTDI